MATNATKYLNILGVNVRVNSKVKQANELPDGNTEIILASGDKLTTDVYIPTFGVVPNSSYLPKDLLNERGYVKVDDLLGVKGAAGVYAIGEVSDCEVMRFVALEAQSKHMANNAVLIAAGKQPLVYKKNAPSKSPFLSPLFPARTRCCCWNVF
jgi:pyruvate/2-oxoglutarate dehydrogenase complex dihydrolipoamide dehydrogenase (E3) component